jgi:hypothetical protein
MGSIWTVETDGKCAGLIASTPIPDSERFWEVWNANKFQIIRDHFVIDEQKNRIVYLIGFNVLKSEKLWHNKFYKRYTKWHRLII